MFDLHSHLLPSIDDGAIDIDDAVSLAKMAVADGITHMVCTPHIHPGRYENDKKSIETALTQLRAALQKNHVNLSVSAAAEVRFDMQLMQGVLKQEVPFLGSWQGKNVLLLEFPHSEIPFGAEQLTKWLLKHDVIPMIAHPERNKGLMRQPTRLKPFIEMGCLLQVTAGSVAGRFGESAQNLAHELLRQDLVTILASDAHNTQYRPPILSEGLAATSSLIGENKAKRLVLDSPREISQQHFDQPA